MKSGMIGIGDSAKKAYLPVLSQIKEKRRMRFNHKDKQTLKFGSDEWEPILYKRGFYGGVSAFLVAVKNGESF